MSRLPFLGEKGPRCYERLAPTLAVLEIAACCGLGCPGDDDPHFVQRLLGRVVANANAGLFLATSGYYDESLALSRNIGEVANLLWLFRCDNTSLSEWAAADGSARWIAFRPAEVRRKLKRLDQVIPVEESEYSALSEVAAHVGPTTAPQTLGAHRRPNLGGFFSEEAFLVSLNELAWATGVTCFPAAGLLPAGSSKKQFLQTAAGLLEVVGGARLSQLPEFWSGSKDGA